MAGQVGDSDGDLGFQIAPMVDVVFVLVLFFMATTGAQISELELGVTLPSSGGKASEAPITPIFIDIAESGQASVNGIAKDNTTNKDMPELTEWLGAAMKEFGAKDPVIIRPEPKTRQERVIAVLNAAAAAGVKNLTFN